MPDRNADPPDTDALSFEQAIARLETMIDEIESGEVGLEDAIARYELGRGLVTRCRLILDKAEQRIAELSPTPGSPTPGSGSPDDPSDTDPDE